MVLLHDLNLTKLEGQRGNRRYVSRLREDRRKAAAFVYVVGGICTCVDTDAMPIRVRELEPDGDETSTR